VYKNVAELIDIKLLTAFEAYLAYIQYISTPHTIILTQAVVFYSKNSCLKGQFTQNEQAYIHISKHKPINA